MKIERSDRLISYLETIPGERVFLHLKDYSYTFKDILEKSVKFQNDHSELAGKNCAVLSEDRESLAIYLPAVDSLCANIFLQPDSNNIQDSEFYQSANIEAIVKLGRGKVISVDSFCEHEISSENNSEVHEYILATSGTTGSPKLAKYSLESLTATAQKSIERGNEFVWGLSYEINRFAGLQVYLQSVVSGSTLVIPPKDEDISSMLQIYADRAVNCLSATPSFWRKILMIPTHRNIPLKRITLGGEISTQSILNALSNSYPYAKIIHIYASTEAGVGFAVKDTKEGFPLQFVYGDPSLPCQIKIKDGLLWIRNRNGCNGFIKGSFDIDSDGFVNTGDLVVKKMIECFS